MAISFRTPYPAILGIGKSSLQTMLSNILKTINGHAAGYKTPGVKLLK
ncbi:hypothetical protein [uncultured Bartonella sp.]|nr:hypothetical protein [uncultured Bartonella sp.]